MHRVYAAVAKSLRHSQVTRLVTEGIRVFRGCLVEDENIVDLRAKTCAREIGAAIERAPQAGRGKSSHIISSSVYSGELRRHPHFRVAGIQSQKVTAGMAVVEALLRI